MFTIAIEGPSFSGKTTLGSELVAFLGNEAILIPEYMSLVEMSDLEAFPFNEAGWLARSEFFLQLDAKRNETFFPNSGERQFVIMDRSVHTLLAHTWALSNPFGPGLFQSYLTSVLSKENILWPELLIYLDTPQHILEKRFISRPATPSQDLFKQRQYNALFREYFLSTRPEEHSHKKIVVDGCQTTAEILSLLAPLFH